MSFFFRFTIFHLIQRSDKKKQWSGSTMQNNKHANKTTEREVEEKKPKIVLLEGNFAKVSIESK